MGGLALAGVGAATASAAPFANGSFETPAIAGAIQAFAPTSTIGPWIVFDSDNLQGGSGNDNLQGGAGEDTLQGRRRHGRHHRRCRQRQDPGRLRQRHVNVRDGVRGETVSCGSGVDKVYADSNDAVVSSCETVIFGPRP